MVLGLHEVPAGAVEETGGDPPLPRVPVKTAVRRRIF
jgi:hypothetical protein